MKELMLVEMRQLKDEAKEESKKSGDNSLPYHAFYKIVLNNYGAKNWRLVNYVPIGREVYLLFYKDEVPYEFDIIKKKDVFAETLKKAQGTVFAQGGVTIPLTMVFNAINLKGELSRIAKDDWEFALPMYIVGAPDEVWLFQRKKKEEQPKDEEKKLVTCTECGEMYPEGAEHDAHKKTTGRRVQAQKS